MLWKCKWVLFRKKKKKLEREEKSEKFILSNQGYYSTGPPACCNRFHSWHQVGRKLCYCSFIKICSRFRKKKKSNFSSFIISSLECGYTLEQQFSLLKSIRPLFADKVLLETTYVHIPALFGRGWGWEFFFFKKFHTHLSLSSTSAYAGFCGRDEQSRQIFARETSAGGSRRVCKVCVFNTKKKNICVLNLCFCVVWCGRGGALKWIIRFG